jgi:hypothetical protein
MLDRFKKGGGGFLHNVDALIKSVVITTDPDFENDGSQLWAKITVRQDGATEDVTTNLRIASDSEQYVIGDDGTSLTPVEGAGLYANEPFLVLYSSAVENGLDDPDPDDDGAFHFGHLAGARVCFVQEKDEEGMASLVKWLSTPKGKQALKAGKYNELGQKQNKKDKKYYDSKLLKIAAVYETGLDVSGDDAPKGKKATNGSGKVLSAAGRSSATTAVKKAAAKEADDTAQIAQDTIVAILGDAKNNTITKKQINLLVTQALAADKVNREPVRGWLNDDTNLAALVENGVIEMAAKGKDTVISLA